MFRRGRGSALSEWLENLSEGDPVAISIAVGVAVLVAIVVGVYLYDRKQRANEGKKAGRGSGRK